MRKEKPTGKEIAEKSKKIKLDPENSFETEKKGKKVKFNGYLFSNLHLIGSKSEGPAYFIQKWDYRVIRIAKQTHLWEEDKTLHKFLGKKVTITGHYKPGIGIDYEAIQDFEPSTEAIEEKEKLNIDFELGGIYDDSLGNLRMTLKLKIKWPYRSIWNGVCPTSKIYDFFILKDKKIIWIWSKDKMFLMVLTPVIIPGGELVEYSGTWHFSSKMDKTSEYEARGIFIASNQEVSKTFKIKPEVCDNCKKGIARILRCRKCKLLNVLLCKKCRPKTEFCNNCREMLSFTIE